MYEWGQGLTLSQNVDWGFLLSTAFPVGGVITQPHYIYIYIYIEREREMSAEGVMSSKQANNNHGLCTIKEQ